MFERDHRLKACTVSFSAFALSFVPLPPKPLIAPRCSFARITPIGGRIWPTIKESALRYLSLWRLMDRDLKVWFVNRQPQSAVLRWLMLLAYMTCMAMFRSGAWMNFMRIIGGLLRTGALGHPLKRGKYIFYVAGPGPTIRGTVALRTAAGSIPPTATTSSVFGSAVRPPGLFLRPLPFSPLFSIWGFLHNPSKRYSPEW